jgi:hypothetical protein
MAYDRWDSGSALIIYFHGARKTSVVGMDSSVNGHRFPHMEKNKYINNGHFVTSGQKPTQA